MQASLERSLLAEVQLLSDLLATNRLSTVGGDCRTIPHRGDPSR